MSSYLEAEQDRSKASEPTSPGGPTSRSQSHPAVDKREGEKTEMQNQSFQSNTERNNAKFLHVDVLFIYLFVFTVPLVSQHRRKQEDDSVGHCLPNFAASPTKQVVYIHIYLSILTTGNNTLGRTGSVRTTAVTQKQGGR